MITALISRLGKSCKFLDLDLLEGVKVLKFSRHGGVWLLREVTLIGITGPSWLPPSKHLKFKTHLKTLQIPVLNPNLPPLHHQMGGHRSTLPGRSGAVGGGGRGSRLASLSLPNAFPNRKSDPLLICRNLATLASPSPLLNWDPVLIPEEFLCYFVFSSSSSCSEMLKWNDVPPD